MTYDEARLPLARLFAMGFRMLMDDLHERLATRGFKDIRRSFGFVLLAARQGPVTVGDVAELLGVTKQAASKIVSQLEESRYIKRVSAEADARSRPFVLSSRGERLLAEVERIYVELEQEWAETLSPNAIERFRKQLTQVIRARHGGQLPAVRPG